MRTPLSLAIAALIASLLAACASAPAAPDPVPPPQRPYDAKTQLEYGEGPPPGPRR